MIVLQTPGKIWDVRRLQKPGRARPPSAVIVLQIVDVRRLHKMETTVYTLS